MDFQSEAKMPEPASWPVPPPAAPELLAREDAPSILTGGRGVQPDTPMSLALERALSFALPSDDPRLGGAALMRQASL